MISDLNFPINSEGAPRAGVEAYNSQVRNLFSC